MISNTELTFFLSCLLLMQLLHLAVAQSLYPKEECISERGNYNNGSSYQADLSSLLTSFSKTQVEYGFYNSSVGEVHGMGLCRPDVLPDDCRNCISDAGQDVLRLCPNYKEAILYEDNCTLRYSNHSISGSQKYRPNYILYNVNNFSDVDVFRETRDNLLLDLRQKAASGDTRRKYATGTATADMKTIYALVQCTPDLEYQGCFDCLDGLSGDASESFRYKKGGQAKAPSCNLRFETDRFYDPVLDAEPASPADPPSPPPPGGGNGMHLIHHDSF